MKYKHFLSFILGVFFFFTSVYSQNSKNLAERLGYPKDAKLLIIHGDDMGLSHSTNMAYLKAFEEKAVSAGSIMVPCPWFLEIAKMVQEHPGWDVGLHLTLNAEWNNYKWGGVSPSVEIPSLLDKNGYLFPTVEEFAQHAKPEEVEKELRAQIDRALAFGIHPTHLDNHMGSFLANPDFFRIAVKLGKEYQIPVFAPINVLKFQFPQILKEIGPDYILVENFQMLYPQLIKGNWEETYAQFISRVTPGLNELIVHLSYNNDEMKGICPENTDYGPAWRQKDFDLVLSDSFKQMLKANNIYLVGWKQVQEAMYPKK